MNAPIPAAILACIVANASLAADHAADRLTLLKGVSTVELLGTPGQLAVTGDESFVVLTDSGGQPAAAAARAGTGRVFAIGHGSYLSLLEKDVQVDGASRLMHNALSWTSGGLDAPRIARVGDPPRAWAEADVLIWGGGNALSPARQARLLAWIRGGGGLIGASCPWGWAQVSGKDLQTRHGQNQVLGPLGIVYGSGYARAHADGAFDVGRSLSDAAHAGTALGRLERGESITNPQSRALEYAVRSVAPDDQVILPRVKVLLSANTIDPPTGKRPAGKSAAVRRAVVSLYSRLWRQTPPEEVTAAPGAGDFPGDVPTDAPRVEATRSFKAAEPGWHSTGLHLAPGEVLRVRPLSGDPTRWRVRIGCHKDGLWRKDSWRRWPDITHVVDLEAGETTVATPWGGLVYVVPRKKAGDVSLGFAGAVEAPLYDAATPGSDERWDETRMAAGPWAELAGRHMVLTMPSVAVRDLDDPRAVTDYWDALWTSHCALLGIDPPARRERFVCDRQISAGYMHSGYPIMMHLDQGSPRPGKNRPAKLLDLEELRAGGNWGCFHELGHNLQRSAWTWGGSVEVTCNYFSLHGGEVMCGIEPWDNPWLRGAKPGAADWVEQGAEFDEWKRSPGKALVIFAQIQREFGWGPFTEVFRQYEAEPRSVWPRRDADKIDLFCTRMSVATGRDLRPLFQKWSLPLSVAVLEDRDLDALEPWMPDFAELRVATP